jgi:glycosyltransferase involved in cell wall biosynthesis
MNVVIVDGDVSYPPTSGKRLRTLNLMLPLAGTHRITYVARGSGNPAEERLAVEFLAGRGIAAVIVDDPIPKKRGLSFYARLAGNLFSPLPYSVASHFSEKMRDAVRQVAASRPVDLFQVEWSGYLYALDAAHTMPVVLQAHNVDALIWQRFHENEKNPLKRWYVARQWRKFERFEGRAFQEVSRVVAVSPDDAALARERFGVESIDVVDNGVDVAHYERIQPAADSRSILYLGSLDWRPNLDALRLLLDSLYPAVRALEPASRLLIVGRHPPDWLRQRVAREDGVELHADVPDVRPFLERSLVMAVPLRIGGGSRLKILESLAAGLPVVSTKVGAEGLALRPGLDYTLADTPEEQVQALLRCLRHPREALAQAEQGRQTVRGRYDWKALAARLERVWGKAIGERTP